MAVAAPARTVRAIDRLNVAVPGPEDTLHPISGLTCWPVAVTTWPFDGLVNLHSNVYGGCPPDAAPENVQDTLPDAGALHGVF